MSLFCVHKRPDDQEADIYKNYKNVSKDKQEVLMEKFEQEALAQRVRAIIDRCI